MDLQSKTFSYAGFWKRLAAFIVDSVIVSAGEFLSGFFLGIPYDVLTGRAEFVEHIPEYVLIIISNILFAWVYYAAMESSRKQATLGEMALGIIVTDLSENRISFGRASGRFFAGIISGFTLGIGFLMIGFTARKQGLHDMIAGCLVIDKNL
ncbi:MAG: RDD family protein [Candidatus Harrisonbacteria bacterium]|nr:RDD family protein [Candidatus Harrisonbacteria bacterium]